MKNVSILGATGSIGTQALDVIRSHRDVLGVCSITASTSVQKTYEIIKEFNPRLAAMYDEESAKKLRKMVSESADEKVRKTEVLAGMDGIIAAAVLDEADIVLSSVVGMIGIKPVIEAIKKHKDIAFANKETLVAAGDIIMPMVREYGVKMLPVDSEHSAIFQSLQTVFGYGDGDSARSLDEGYIKTDKCNELKESAYSKKVHDSINKILLTASGGPFRGMTKEELKNIKPEQALVNPNWKMGRKITVDSSTMVNKGLEVIEACHLFGVTPDKIEVVVHPESIIHSAVEFVDGAVIAQLGAPDMRIAIQYALVYPERVPFASKRLSLTDITSLHFYKPDFENFRGIPLAISAFKQRGVMPTVMNAANEEAVAAFLDGKIRFTAITELIEKAMENHDKSVSSEKLTLEAVLNAEKEAREYVRRNLDEYR